MTRESCRRGSLGALVGLPVQRFGIHNLFNAVVRGVGPAQAAAFATPVKDRHAAALLAGGSDDGAPGFRDAYGTDFYVGYLRDPQGNKIAIFSSHPDDPGRER